MDNDKRIGQQAVPDNLEDWLSPEQMQMLHQIESFGWKIKFIRRPVFQDPIIVLVGDDEKKIGILEKDGHINMDPDIVLRD
jgi:hypothetical protein